MGLGFVFGKAVVSLWALVYKLGVVGFVLLAKISNP